MNIIILCLISRISSLIFKAKISKEDNDFTPHFRNLFEKNISFPQNQQMVATSICLGTPPQCIGNIVFDTGSFGLAIAGSSPFLTSFNSSNSSTFHSDNIKVRINYGSGMVGGELVTDSLYINETNKFTENKFYFILGKDVYIPSYHNGIIGFGKGYDDRYLLQKVDQEKVVNTSFIYYLYKNKIIEETIFSYKQISNDSSIIYVGETGLKKNEKYKKCFPRPSFESDSDLIKKALVDRSAFWTCQYFGFFTENNTEILFNSSKNFDNFYYVFFDSGINFFKVPKPYFEFLKDQYMKASKGKCLRVARNDGIVCNIELDLKILPRYKLNLGNFTIEILPQDVFRVKNDGKHQMYQLTIFYGSEDDPVFTIGPTIMKRYQLIFDMKEGSVGILENEVINLKENIKINLDTIPRKKLRLTGIILYYIVLLCNIFGILFCFLGWRLYRKIINENTEKSNEL